jgi:predicted ribosome quality control (RQC) complex YloA/Tae2 family protein
MMLSLRELRRAARILKEKLTGATLRRVVQPGDQKLMLIFEQSTGKAQVLLSCGPEYSRICMTNPAEPSESPGSFYEYTRAHLPGTSLSKIEVCGDDRQLEIHLQRDVDQFLLILSILGARSNLYLLDGEKRLLHSMRPLDETRHELKIGEVWKNPRGTAPTEGTDRWEVLSDEDYLDAIGRAYDQQEQRIEAEQLIRRMEQALKKERAFLDRKAVNLQEDLGEAKKAETFRHAGELLKNVLHAVRPGDEFVQATDYETGEVHTIPLDPKLSPAANLESYFARYQKESRGVRMIGQQLQDLEMTRAELESIGQHLEEAARAEVPDIAILKSLASQPRVNRLIRKHSPRRKPGASPVRSTGNKQISARLLPKRYMTQDGLEIWVGRSDEGNDYLTTRLARGNDLFFHLEGYPGSHVVLRTEGRPDPPPKSLLDACELAVHFSKMKNSGSAEVHMAHIKDVKKPRGAKPGLVYVRSGKTIHLRRDPKRLQSILASRLDQ